MATNHETFLKKLSKEIVYFANEFEGAVIRSVPDEGIFVKFAGKEEFKAQEGSKLVADAIIEGKEITETTYNNF